MTDPGREKYARLMGRIEVLEEQIEELQRRLAGDLGAIDRPTTVSHRKELQELAEQLGMARSELSRVSDGCGKPHPI